MTSRRPSARPPLRLDRLEDRTTPATLSTFLTTEHVDLNLTYGGGQFGVGVQNSDAGTGYAPDTALLYTGVNATAARPADAAFDFIGVAAGATYYRLPQNQDAELLYLGAAGYGVATSAVNRYDPNAESGGRVSGTAGWVRMTLTDLEHVKPDGTAGTGQLSVWQSGDNGPVVFLASAAGGITAADALWVIAGGHSHYNWGFTEPGRYEVEVRVSANVNTDGNTGTLESVVTGDPVKLYFSVGSVGRFEFAAANTDVAEGVGTATVTVNRVGGSDGRLTVDYATADGTATAGQDYTARSGTLTFEDGETSKTFTVPVTDDGAEEGAETVNLALSNPRPDNIAGYAVGLPGGSLLGSQNTATLTITGNDANTDPTITDVPDQNTPEDTAVTVSFTIGDSPTPADQLTVTATSSNPALVPNTAAALTFGGTGASRTLTVTPAENAAGTATITVTVTDPGGRTASDTFVLTVTAVNDPPTAAPDTAATTEGVAVTVDVLANDSAAPDAGETLTLTGVSAPANGSAVVAAGKVVYTPAADFSGTDTFTYTVADGNGGTATGTVTVTVAGENDPPSAAADAYGVSAGNAVRGNVLLNDADADGDPLTATVATGPAAGAVSLSPNGSFTYTPGPTFAAADSFTYTLSDGNGGTSTATVTITGRPADPVFEAVLTDQHTDVGIAYEEGEWEPHVHDEDNDAEYEPDRVLLRVRPAAATPRPADPAFAFLGVPAGATYHRLPQTPVGGLLLLGLSAEEVAGGVFAGDRLGVRLKAVDGPGHFSVWRNTDAGPEVLMATTNGVTAADTADIPAGGHVDLNWGFSAPGRYALTLQFAGTLAGGGAVESGEATYYLTVDPPNRLPAAADDAFGVTPGNAVRGNVLANDADPDADPLSAAGAGGPAAGTVALSPDGSFTYTPGPAFAGTDSFTYTLADGAGGTATGTVTITGRPATPGFEAVLSEEHADVGIAYEEGEWEPHVHDEDNDVEYEPAGALFHVRPEAAAPRPADPAFAFLGVPAGATYYRLPQAPVGGLVLLGLAAEEIGDGVFVDNRVTVRLKAVDGPGQFSVWRNTDAGPEVLMATADGVTAADATAVPTGGHIDLNWGFSAAGLYAVTLQFSGYLDANGNGTFDEGVDTFTESGEATYYVAVDPPNATPVQTAPAAVATPVGTPVAVAASVADADSGDRPLRVTVEAAAGTVSLAPAAGVTFVAGDGTDDPMVTVEGPAAAVNAALAGMVYTPPAGFTGATALTLTTTDAGVLVGAENARTDTNTVPVTVTPAEVRVERVADAAEPGTAGRLRFTRTGGTGAALAVTYTVGGTATAADFAPLSGTVTFPAGAGEVTVDVVPVDNAAVTGPRTLVVTPAAGDGYTTPGGPATVTITDDDRPTPPRPQPVAAGSGGQARLADGQTVRPFGGGYAGEVRVARGDVTGDGTPDLIAGAGPGHSPLVKVYDGATGAEVHSFFAFEQEFTGGVFVAAADFDGDGRAEVVVSPDQGGGPRVRVLAPASRAVLADFFGIDDPAFRGGARVAAGDVNADGVPDLVVAAGFGGGPRVALFDGRTVRPGQTPAKLVNDRFVFEDGLRNGSYVAVGDTDGDGYGELVFGAGPGGGPRVRVLDGKAYLAGQEVEQASFFAGDDRNRSGVPVGTADPDGDGRWVVVAGTAAGPARVSVYLAPAGGGVTLADEFDAFGTSGGVFVG